MSGLATFGPGAALATLARAWVASWSVPGKYRLLFLSNPLDATRYLEMGYLLRFLRESGLPRRGRALDVSSPVIIAHLLARRGYDVVKTDIDPAQSCNVGGPRMRFERQDARQLSFPEGAFDLVVSISVVEHIHREYRAAMLEMLRVTRPGGHVYLTFPVAREAREEWLDEDIYGSQARVGNRVFFQHRFGEKQYREILDTLSGQATVVEQALFWERRDGDYDRLVGRLRGLPGGRLARHARAAWINLARGPRFFERRARGFDGARSFGNAQIILRKAAITRSVVTASMSSNDPRR